MPVVRAFNIKRRFRELESTPTVAVFGAFDNEGIAEKKALEIANNM